MYKLFHPSLWKTFAHESSFDRHCSCMYGEVQLFFLHIVKKMKKEM